MSDLYHLLAATEDRGTARVEWKFCPLHLSCRETSLDYTRGEPGAEPRPHS